MPLDSLNHRLAIEGRDTSRVSTLDALAWTHLNLAHYDTAQALLRKALPLARTLHFGVGEARTLYYIGEAYSRQAKLPEAVASLLEAESAAKRTQTTSQLPSIYHTLAVVYNTQGNYDAALATAQKALKLCAALHDEKRAFKAWSDMGFTYSQKGDFPRALQCYLESVKIQQKVGVTSALARTYASIGNLYDDQDNIPRALEYYQKGLALLKPEDPAERNTLGRFYVNMGVLNSKQNHNTEAERLFLEAKKIFESLHQPADVGASIAVLANLLTKTGQLQKALPYHQQALHLLEQGADQSLILSAQFNLADTYAKLGQTAQAEKLASQCLALAQKLGTYNCRYEAATLLAQLRKQRGDYKQALEYTEIANATQDSLFSKEKSEALGKLQGDFELSQERNRVSTLRKDQQIQAQQLRQQRFVVIGLAVGFLVVLLAGLALWRVNKLLGRKNREIDHQRATLAQLNATKDRLFSIIGHDLRGPLNSLHAFVSLLNIRQLPQEKLMQYSQRLNQTLDQTLALIDNLLSWAAVQMQASERVNPESLLLEEAVNENFRLLRTAAEHKNLTISHLLEGDEWAWADPDMVRLVLRNLLSNAIKFTPQGGRITVAATEADAQWCLSVTDTGVGLDGETLHQLLGVAASPQSTVGTAQEPGTGLGLVLCRDFVERNGGRLWAESAGPGQGTTFHFTLPRAGALSVVA
ncbi:tetratricopeptide repeat protein [Hymenobacter sp. BT491]|uniref:ATP-binding protein n=1 Tax=Hymenobacter sp. BT491 TaxID=2766779 RepID=UPI0016537B06|nr:tetratricopeptide repeat protein [Hymenobacter sp. BT491]MBC6989115.1 tetratricopeptide repeat protein [Hymenobacter sp. BT491]